MYPLNRGCLSFCVTVVTFRGYHSFCLCKTIRPQCRPFVVVIWWPFNLTVNLYGFWTRIASWLVKTICFVQFHCFALFFPSWFCYKTIAIYSKSILSARLVLVKRSLVRICCYLQWFRHRFFKEAPLGRPKVWYCRQSHFFEKHFYFLPKMSLTTVSHFGPLDPCPRDHLMSKSFVLLKEFDVFFLKTSILLKEFNTFWPWLASGAPLGPWASPWSPFLDVSGHISGLGRSLGSFLGASVSFLVCFYCFSTSHGIIFSKFQA